MNRNTRQINIRTVIFRAMALLVIVLGGVLVLNGCRQRGQAKVEISEIMSGNAQAYVDETYGAVDWIELHNAGSASVSLNGWFLTDKYDSMDTDCSLPNITLAPDDYCLIFADKAQGKAESRCLPFGISRDGETLYLYNTAGEEIARLQVPSLEKDVSWARRTDGTYGYSLLPTPGKENGTVILDQMPTEGEETATIGTLLEYSPLEISEVVSSNGLSLEEDPYGAVDWIELHNRSGEAISLQGWHLSDKSILSDESRALPAVTIPANGYYVILADTEGAEQGDRCLPFSISKAGETLYLFDPSGQWAAVIDVPALWKDISWALGQDGQYGYCLYPTPGEANTTEITAEPPEETDWVIRMAGRRSLVMLRINEICSAPDSRTPDWIELFNPTDQPVDVTGFYLSDSSSDPMKSQLPALTVPAKGYLAVPLGAAADPAAGATAFSLSSKGETIYLYDKRLGLVDTVDVPALQEGLVYARRADGTFGYCGAPTPGEANTSGIYAESLRTMASDAPIHINEGLFRNKYSVIDSFGDHSDWVELVNRSKAKVSLAGYYLSDSQYDPRKWALPDTELAPGEYLLVFLSGRDQRTGELHASFSVSKRDGGCCLYNASTLEMERLPNPEDLKENVSIGLDQEGKLLYYRYPTPGYDNAAAFSDQEACGLPNGDLIISEVSAGGDSGDWIELYNRGSKKLNLTGWSLSNDERNLQKLTLGNVKLNAKSYYVVSLEAGNAAAPFGISLSGEELLLTDKQGIVRDIFATGALRQGMTSGREADDASCQRVFYSTATKGKKNGTPIAGYAAAPYFSDLSLYHDTPFELTLTAEKGTVIHYTLDGSAPTAQSAVYSGPLTIGKNTTVRAIGMAEGRFDSEEAVATYLFRKAHTLPVVCIAAEPGRWSQLTKVPHQEAGLTEQLAWIQFYEADGSLGTFFPAGISPRGNASLGYPQKSLSIHLRGRYGKSSVAYPFWGEKSFLSYKFLVLRNGSQDIRSARLRDSFASRAAENMHVMTAWTRPVIVYVNGTYYGIMDLNEGMNQDYLWTHYQVEGSLVNMVQRNDHVKRGSAKEFVALRQFARGKKLADDKAYEEFQKKVDMDAFIDYLIAQSFFGNYDIHNQNWWNSTDGTILWQPILYDVDRCLNETSASSNVLGMYFNSSGVVHNRVGDRIMMEIPCGLKKNATWCKRFVERYAELLCTDLSEERLSSLLDEMAAALRPEMKEHTALWKMPESLKSWESNIKEMHQCISKRYSVISSQIRHQFSLSDADWKALLNKYKTDP